MRWRSVSSFSIAADTVGVLSVPMDKNLKKWGWANVGAVPRKLIACGRTLIRSFSLFLLWRTHSWSLSKHFRYTLCLLSMCFYVVSENGMGRNSRASSNDPEFPSSTLGPSCHLSTSQHRLWQRQLYYRFVRDNETWRWRSYELHVAAFYECTEGPLPHTTAACSL